MTDHGKNTAIAAIFAVILCAAVSLAWSFRSLPVSECSWCHRTARLERHHIVPQHIAPALRDVPSNLIVLCRDCHFCIGHRCNWKSGNPDVKVICDKFTNAVRAQ